MTPDELFLEWGAGWISRDPAERERRLRGCCLDDVEFIPPDERPVVRGVEALLGHIGTYTASWPEGMQVKLARPAESHHDWSRGLVCWIFPSVTAQGTDIINIKDGKIARMLVFADRTTKS
jgi:hypothetical protein